MHPKTALLVLPLTLAAGAWAQTKIAGTVQCGKSEPVYSIPVGDRPDHVFMISKGKCTWAEPREIAGIQIKDLERTLFIEVTGAKARIRGVGVTHMANGDKCFTSTQATGTVKEGVIESAEGTFGYTGGTGKLKGIRGKGTTKGKGAADGAVTLQVEGEYQLPKPYSIHPPPSTRSPE